MAQLDVVKKLVDTLEARQENIVLVVSAFEGVTNTLIAAMDELNGKDYTEEDIDRAFGKVWEKHEAMIVKFFKDKHVELAKDKYTAGFTILKQALMTHGRVSKSLMPAEGSFQIRDQVIGFGERMAGALLNEYLEQEGKNAHFIDNVVCDQDTLESGPVTDRSLHEAKKKGISQAIRAGADEARGNVIRILGGHVGGTPKGLIAHQSRGYSDIMAVDTALALTDMGESVKETRFWKDVDGVYTANPKDLDSKKNKPVLHRDVSSAEALENASAGSGLINVNALSLAGKHGLDLHIRNIKKFDPDFGTNITTGSVDTKYLFKTIVSNPHVDALTITLPEMADKDGFAAAIIGKFSDFEVNLDQICTEGTSMTFSIPLPSDKADQEACRERIRKVKENLKVIEVKGERFTVQDIEWDKEKFASVSVIGKELRDRCGILGSISTTFGAFGINVYTVSHGKKQTRITYLIDQKDRKKAVQLLHSVYVDNDSEVKEERLRRQDELEKGLTGTFNGGS